MQTIAEQHTEVTSKMLLECCHWRHITNTEIDIKIVNKFIEI